MIGFYFPKGNEEFEYDVRGLLGSFYPGEEQFKLGSLADEAAADCRLIFAVPDLPDIADKAERKNAVKREFYRMLSADTGKELPWGTLTGIRPTKLVTQKLEEGWPIGDEGEKQGIHSWMRKNYLVSEEKLKLSEVIAEEEQRVLAGIHYREGWSLYIGIPFCPTRCLYCSFTAYPIALWKNRVQDYLTALFKEMDATAELFRGKILDTIYIGGGTPTSLSAEELEQLLRKITETFDLSQLKEFTVEAGRPDSITRDKLRVLRRYPVTRISVNPQTMNDETLHRIGRLHTVEDIEKAFAMARGEGIDNINMDIILGLPGETSADVAETIRRIGLLKPDSLTVHALAVKRASRLKMEAAGTVIPGPDQEEAETMMRIAREGAEAMGLKPYYLYRQKNMAGNLENVGFAAPGKAGIYNILIMEEKQSIAALGAGTVSKAVWPDGLIERADDVKEVKDYIDRIDEMIERKRKLWH